MTTSTDDTVLTIDKVKEAMGDEGEEFIKVLEIVQSIIDHLDDWTGQKALRYANLLAAYRTKISVKAQHYKSLGLKVGSPGKIQKDILLSMYSSLEENINCLKLLGRESR